jgi:hypothetical protein
MSPYLYRRLMREKVARLRRRVAQATRKDSSTNTTMTLEVPR